MNKYTKKKIARAYMGFIYSLLGCIYVVMLINNPKEVLILTGITVIFLGILVAQNWLED